jgi:hypothetical protein
VIDRYTKIILTVIAGALLYIAAILAPLPGLSAQQPSLRPGEPSGPTQVVIVGWQTGAREPIPVSIQQTQPLRIIGQVTTERSAERADRVVLVGWESGADRDKPMRLRPITDASRLPVELPKEPPR